MDFFIDFNRGKQGTYFPRSALTKTFRRGIALPTAAGALPALVNPKSSPLERFLYSRVVFVLLIMQ
jgi:hypothetical protein